MDTKMNTHLVEAVTIEREKPNGFFSNVTLGIDIGLFLITLIIFVCGTFEHTDVKYKKWMPQSKGLLMLVVLQLFSSHLFRHLFTLFGLDVAGGFLFSSRLLELIIGCYHLYFWIEGLLAEQPPGTVGELLVKTLLACLCMALTCKESFRLAEDFRFVQTFSATSQWTDICYYILAGIYWILALCLWINAMRAERTLDIPNAKDLDETRESTRAKAEKNQVDQEEVIPMDVPAPNYNQFNRFVSTASFLTFTLWLHGQLATSYLLPSVSLYSVIFGRYLITLADLFMFMAVSPSGAISLDDDFGAEDDPYYDDYAAREGEDYQGQTTPGFIEGLKQNERLKQSQAARELEHLNSGRGGSKPTPRMDHRNMDPTSDPEDIEVDVDVDNLDEDPEGDDYDYEDGQQAAQFGSQRVNTFGQSRQSQYHEDHQEDDEDV